MHRIKIIGFLLLFINFSFAQNSKLINTGTYTEFLTSLGKCIEHKQITEIKKSFFIHSGKIVVTEGHEELYLNTEKLCHDESIIKFGKLLQTTPKRIIVVTDIANRKAKSRFGITVEKALKVFLNSNASKPHLRDVVIVLHNGKWFLVDY